MNRIPHCFWVNLKACRLQAVLVGCVPIVIQDGVEMAFEEVLPWDRFSLRLNLSDVPALPQILDLIPPSVVR